MDTFTVQVRYHDGTGRYVYRDCPFVGEEPRGGKYHWWKYYEVPAEAPERFEVRLTDIALWARGIDGQPNFVRLICVRPHGGHAELARPYTLINRAGNDQRSVMYAKFSMPTSVVMVELRDLEPRREAYLFRRAIVQGAGDARTIVVEMSSSPLIWGTAGARVFEDPLTLAGLCLTSPFATYPYGETFEPRR